MIKGDDPKFIAVSLKPNQEASLKDRTDNDSDLYLNTVSRGSNGLTPFEITPPLAYDTSRTNSFRIIGMSLAYLYRFAFFGEHTWDNFDNPLYRSIWYAPILEIKDSSIFNHDIKYSYYFKAPIRSQKKVIMSDCQAALENCFGFRARIEKRMFPCWIVKFDSSFITKVVSKGGPSTIVRPNGKFLSFEARNVPAVVLVRLLWAIYQLHIPNQAGQLPFFDETGLRCNIDVKITCLLTDFYNIKEALFKYGFYLQKGYKEMLCLVISE
jgi:hypothetical protein